MLPPRTEKDPICITNFKITQIANYLERSIMGKRAALLILVVNIQVLLCIHQLLND